METFFEPLHQSRLRRGQVDACHTDLGESKLPRQRLNTGYELPAADHLPIVETRHWPSEEDTLAFASRMAQAMSTQPDLANSFIALHGDLGAGKTTFVRHLLHALGVRGRIKSPTYAVVEPHAVPSGLAIHHFDFYRFADPREWEDAGFRDIFAGPGLKLAEWPQKAAGRIPLEDLAIKIEAMSDDTRTVTLQASTPRGAQLLKALHS
jgi:tRNA threonylcarbamoyladenosine biosynthesis protein TsaE|nr:tRNA (adenosine(37)-N6)-threonylcarbamoyltransferase complex ATPase subunit type 1 TsaE [Variovorax soli]